MAYTVSSYGVGMANPEAAVDALYLKYLGRSAEASGLQYWVGESRTRGLAFVEQSIADAPEAKTPETRARVIEGFYRAFLGRAAEPSGMSYWQGVYASQGRAAVEQGIATSEEASKYRAAMGGGSYGTVPGYGTPHVNARNAIESFYVKYLGRNAEPSGMDYWLNVSTTQGLAHVEGEIERSPEAASPEARTRVIDGLYVTYLGRNAEPSGMSYWQGVYASQGRAAVERGIATSEEANRHRGGFQGGAGAAPVPQYAASATIDSFYVKYLGRHAEPEGMATWTSQAATRGLAYVEGEIANSGEAKSPAAQTRVIEGLYLAYLGRVAEPSGLQYWLGVYASQGRAAVEQGIATSEEAKNRRRW